MSRDRWVALLLCLAALAFFAAPPRRNAVTTALTWWRDFGRTPSNLLPMQRGLNVAVLDADGRLHKAQAFDTYWQADSGFAEFISALPSDVWVVVVVQDDAATSLSAADLEGLQRLGGTTALSGRIGWSYILVGRPGIEAGLEWISQKAVEADQPAGTLVSGHPLPVRLRIRSAGYSAGASAWLSTGATAGGSLLPWVRVALRRS